MTSRPPYRVLFLCTGNSARSILAEVMMNAMGAPRFKAYSAGSYPNGTVNPFAIELLQKNRLPVEGLRSKSWDEFGGDDAPPMDLVITVCDNAAGEVCPYWPGQPATAHHGEGGGHSQGAWVAHDEHGQHGEDRRVNLG